MKSARGWQTLGAWTTGLLAVSCIAWLGDLAVNLQFWIAALVGVALGIIVARLTGPSNREDVCRSESSQNTKAGRGEPLAAPDAQNNDCRQPCDQH
jgi:hypothetical protein